MTDGPLRLERVRGAIELDDVWFSRPRSGLRGVTLRVAPGERVALVGASSDGKSDRADAAALGRSRLRGSCGSTGTTCAT